MAQQKEIILSNKFQTIQQREGWFVMDAVNLDVSSFNVQSGKRETSEERYQTQEEGSYGYMGRFWWIIWWCRASIFSSDDGANFDSESESVDEEI